MKRSGEVTEGRRAEDDDGEQTLCHATFLPEEEDEDFLNGGYSSNPSRRRSK